MAKWLDATVLKRIDWNPHLFSLQFSCPEFPNFKAGQFAKVGIETAEGQVLSRPYSLVNSPNSKTLEILAVPVVDGSLSPKLQDLAQGDSLKLMSMATGFLVVDEIPDSKHLFMLATGTGVGPFLSILQGQEVWGKHEKLVLIYATRTIEDLAYLALIEEIQQHHHQQFIFIPVVSREPYEQGLNGRIPQLIEQNLIQQKCGISITPEDSQIMLCGNPDMITDTIQVLTKLGLKKHLRRSPGQISMERYW